MNGVWNFKLLSKLVFVISLVFILLSPGISYIDPTTSIQGWRMYSYGQPVCVYELYKANSNPKKYFWLSKNKNLLLGNRQNMKLIKSQLQMDQTIKWLCQKYPRALDNINLNLSCFTDSQFNDVYKDRKNLCT